ncbi:MAG: DegV family EDD domain-containing protein [Oscillospiraceae bacterium]|nr:DegV family EDD domain-containing protein [Oscillospiraceae bacterium]MBQ2384528.1 DegV family EDD domain-containing protein [Oscillospiraceae bacterium]MBQ5711563.1 DegV family EDD domain-containing protein [Oscillospiraceae bacterium]
MENKIILLAETGSDIPASVAKEKGIYLVPMHVTMGDETLDDGAFPPEEVCAYYDRTGKVPTTSASIPHDFTTVLTQIRREHPGSQILHLAYSAVTTCSYQNALLAGEGQTDIRSVDTKHVSVGQCAVVLAMADYLMSHPDITLEQAAAEAERISARTQMCFIPRNLDYLRAGGRVSNAVALVGNLLGLHPCIEIIDGKLIAGKKYRGNMTKTVPTLIREYTEKHALDRSFLYFIQSPYLEEDVKQIAETTARELGFRATEWIKTGCVITCHGGPGAFGIVGTCADQ